MRTSYATGLRCIKCGQAYPKKYLLECSVCKGLLELQYDLEGLARIRPCHLEGLNLWRYAPFLPIENSANFVSLGEGMTPLLFCPRLAEVLGLRELYIKFEGTNPTGTLKDRSSATAVSAALEFGYRATAVVSTGNAGSSLAAYSARAGLYSFIFCYEKGAQPKMAHMGACASELVLYKGGYDDLIKIYDRLMEEEPIFECGASRNPYKQEGKKTIAYEIYEQLGERVPDYFISPVAVGETFIATWRGFNEMKAIGWSDKLPTMVAAQARRANPVALALASRGPLVPQRIGYTIAEGVAVGDPGKKGEWVLRILREAKGLAGDASDEEIIEAQGLLAKTEGIWAGPTGCVTVAVLRDLVAKGAIPCEASVVCLVSETGLKGEYPRIEQEAIEPTLETVRRILQKALDLGSDPKAKGP
ncbi:MAG: threonine synthase [candidate division NC10 bacterium]|nr:threonine synthase [candidate division NC10 bacterium]